MPDKRRHRGKHPEDDFLFAPDRLPTLRSGVDELSWLLSRGYAPDSTVKLVGDRHNLNVRQRAAMRRSACSDEDLRRRRAAEMTVESVPGHALSVDGYNLLITIESALSGGIILIGRDGCYRDLASLHGTYRRIDETRPALELILARLDEIKPSSVTWLLDKPVSNSGRLRSFMAALVEERHKQGLATPELAIRLVDSPDRELVAFKGVVATSDSAVLDQCAKWLNLAGDIVTRCTPEARTINLGAREMPRIPP